MARRTCQHRRRPHFFQLDDRCRLSSMPCSGVKRGRGDESKVELAGGSRVGAGPGSRSSSCAESSEALLSMRGALSLLELPRRPKEAERRIRPSMSRSKGRVDGEQRCGGGKFRCAKFAC